MGTVSVLQFLATLLLLSPLSGSLADRLDRRKLLILATAISAAGAVGLAVWVGLSGVEGLPGVWPILAATAIIGLGYAIGISAMNALVPALVEREDLEEAIALNSSSFTLARASARLWQDSWLLPPEPLGRFLAGCHHHKLEPATTSR